MNLNGKAITGIVLILLGIMFLLDTLDVVSFGDMIRDYWPLLLVLGGAQLLLRGRQPAGKAQPSPGEEKTSTTADEINYTNLFGDVDANVASGSFRGGLVSTVFGDTTIDLRGITLAEGEQRLKISGVFGDTHIVLPQGLPFAASTSTVFGSITVAGHASSGFPAALEYATPGYDASPRRLRIELTQVFGDHIVEG